MKTLRSSAFKNWGAFALVIALLAVAGVLTSCTPDQNRLLGRDMLRVQLGGQVENVAEWNCLNKLWTRESGWNEYARNRSSGAYGIPQSLPASKMASAGADYLTSSVTQIRWGLDYIQARYGTPCNAWSHSQRTGWY
jgi:hypothetical protein